MVDLILAALIAPLAAWLGVRVERHLAAVRDITGRADIEGVRRHAQDLAKLGKAVR